MQLNLLKKKVKKNKTTQIFQIKNFSGCSDVVLNQKTHQTFNMLIRVYSHCPHDMMFFCLGSNFTFSAVLTS